MNIRLTLVIVMAAGAVTAQTNYTATESDNLISEFFARSARIQSEQPSFVAPMVTVTPRLLEQVRYDQSWDVNNKGAAVTSYGGGRAALELTPYDNIEVLLGIPSYQAYTKSAMSGFADENLLLKYRFAAANESNGNYIATGTLGLSIPTGKETVSSHHFSLTPGLGVGKGWGDFDIQSTLGVAIPDNGSAPRGTGTPLLINTAFQYRFLDVLWPEVELNYSYWGNGEYTGKNQLFVSPGFIVGKLPLCKHLGVIIGVGYQVALTQAPLYNHNYIISARLPF